jgi:hypothetical protein
VIVAVAQRPTKEQPGFLGSSSHRALEGFVEAHVALAVNLIASHRGAWDTEGARAQAQALLVTLRAARDGRPLTLVCLGRLVADAFGLGEPLARTWWKGVRLVHLPHPSGRCHWWGAEENRRAAWELWRELEAEGP